MRAARDNVVTERGVRGPPADLLTATIAHELNNIVASLRGFLELAREAGAAGTSLSAFDEISLGVKRVAELAADVEIFAGVTAPAEVVALENCLRVTEGAEPAATVRWLLPRSTRVMTEPGAAHRAFTTLARLAALGDTAPALDCHAEPAATSLTRCAVCGAECGQGAAWITLSLPKGRSGLGIAPNARRSCLTATELRFAALSRAAHHARGHLVVQNSPDSVSLVLPLA